MQNTSFEENDQTFELEQISRNKSFRIYILHTFQNLKNSISCKSNYTNFDWILKTIEKRRKLLSLPPNFKSPPTNNVLRIQRILDEHQGRKDQLTKEDAIFRLEGEGSNVNVRFSDFNVPRKLTGEIYANDNSTSSLATRQW